MKKFIRYLYLGILKLIQNLSALFLFIVPNLKVILCKKFFYTNIPKVQQLVKYSGKGKVFIGKNCSFGYKLGGFYKYGYIEFQSRYKNAIIKIGNNVAMNNNICVCAANKIEIGNDTLIGQFVTIMDFDAHGISPNKRKKIGVIGEVIIGENVWIGNNVVILKNSKIGNNSIVAAGAVVAGSFSENIIIGGVPAIIIKSIE